MAANREFHGRVTAPDLCKGLVDPDFHQGL
jgi:hypothetical protein